MHDDLSRAAEALGVNISTLTRAAVDTKKGIESFKSLVLEGLGKFSAEEVKDADLILLGSIARQEVTTESDCDYIVLQNGCLPDVSQKLLAIADKVREDLDFAPPGRQGVFGDIVIAASLYERIGLESDTNQNLTHRMLLLTESTSVLSSSTNNTHDTVIRNILRRYCADYLPPRRAEDSPARVPRYLANDLIRFWRTMAVDFGAKRWRSSRDDSFLRLTKLRTTRKILFAGPLCSLLLAPDRIKVGKDLPEYLRLWLTKPPLAQLASIASDECLAARLSSTTMDALKNILVSYDKLLSLFSERGVREAFKDPDGMGQIFKDIARQCKEIAGTIQSGLEVIFFDDPVFKDRFRKYSVF